MDDNDKKPPRNKGPGRSGPKTSGPRRDGAAGKPSFGAKKPYAPRGARPAAADGERPKRDFKGDRPFSKGPRPEGKPYEKREGPRKPYAPRGDRPMAAEGERPKRDFKSGDRPFSKGPRPEGKPYEKREGPRKPYAPRGDRPTAAEGERPKRDFKSGDRPFNKGPRPEGKPYEKREGPRKPYAPRGDRPMAAEGERPKRDFKGGDRPFSKGPRPEGKPYEKREGPRRPYGDRPATAEAEKRFDRPKRDFSDRAQRDAGDRPKRDFSDRPKRDFGGDRSQGASGGSFKPRSRPADATEEPGERIAKRLARAGLASRRDAEELIAAGRVKVNGRALTSPAFNVMPGDIIHLDGMEIPPIERTRLFLFHKPAGVVTTNRDPEGRKTVFDVLPADLPRLMTIGRLDINTEGLLLLTNDGGLSRVLELPATGWLRRYRVRVHGKVEESALAGLREGIAVDGVFYGAIEASLDREQGSNAWLTIGLREGKNREVKNILGSLGLDVTRLIRISYGPFQLEDLAEGHVLEIKGRVLRDQLGERLIEDSGANFDAEITKPFSNQPVRRERDAEPERPKIIREGDHRPIGEGGLIKNRKRREGSRDEALGKLSTSPERGSRPEKSFGERGPRPERSEFRDKPRGDFGDKPRGGFGDKPRGCFGDKARGGKKAEREQRPIEPPGQRKANVWMAPGARPIGKGRAEADAAKAAEAKARKASFKPAYGKPGGAKPFGKPRGERPDGGGERPRGPKGPRTR
jgi:23S rRNA pseudouridine2605 synthase